jgi:hypothetical protein
MTILRDWRDIRAETRDFQAGASAGVRMASKLILGGLRGTLLVCGILAFNGIAQSNPVYAQVTDAAKRMAGPGPVADVITWLQTRSDDERIIAAFATDAAREIPGAILAGLR